MRYATSQDVLKSSKLKAMEQLNKLGFDGLEIVIPDGIHCVTDEGLGLRSDYPDPKSDMVFQEEGRDQLTAKSRETGIEIASICLSFLNQREGLSSENSEERRKAREIIENTIYASYDMNVSTVLLPFFNKAKIGENTGLVVSELRKLAKPAQRMNVTLALETDLPAPEVEDLIDDIGSEYVGVYYDLGNAQWLGYEPASELNHLGNLVKMIHVKDGIKGHSDAMLGEGEVNFKKFRDILLNQEYDGWIVLETTMKRHPLKDAKENLEFLQKLFNTS